MVDSGYKYYPLPGTIEWNTRVIPPNLDAGIHRGLKKPS